MPPHRTPPTRARDRATGEVRGGSIWRHGHAGSEVTVAMREPIIGGILNFLSGYDRRLLVEIRAALEHEIDHAGPDALDALRERLTVDLGWAYYPRDPLARRIHHVLADRFLQKDSAVEGQDYLTPLGASPVAIFANHLSYADANVVEVLLQRLGAETADRLTAVAGPKIFTSPQRRSRACVLAPSRCRRAPRCRPKRRS